MAVKRIVGALLLLFAAGSLVMVAVKDRRQQGRAAPEPATTAKVSEAHPSGQPAGSNQRNPASQSEHLPRQDKRRIVAYYFHGNFRCSSCNAIERWSKETIESSFAKEVKSGLLEFRPVNVEEPGNEHFVKEYQLYAQSLVLVEYVNGKQTRWTNLKRVWELVKDESQFRTYVRSGVRAFLAKGEPK